MTRTLAVRLLAALAVGLVVVGCVGGVDRLGSATPAACPALGPAPFSRSPGGVAEVDVSWLAAHLCAARLVDVRGAAELATGRLPDAEAVSLARLAEVASSWARDDALVIVDRSGRRSGRAVRMLEDMGFSRVASLTGGMLAWGAAGHPLVVATAPEAERLAAASAPSTPLTGAVLEAGLAPAHLRHVKAAALLMQGTEACVDGRAEVPVIGTPGGDAGELLLALAALEETRDRSLTRGEIYTFLDAYLDAFGRLYLHTDEHALAGLRDDPRFGPAIAARGLEAFVRRPGHPLEAALAETLTEPEHVGCGHLRLVLTRPDAYGVRRGLTAMVLRAILQRLWQGAAVDFVVLHGRHEEGAVVRVQLDRPVHAFTRIPTVPTHVGGHALFVHHPEVSAWLRQQNVAFLLEVDPVLGAHPEARAAFLRRVEELGRQQLAATMAALAERLPVFVAHLGADVVRVEGPLR